MVVAMMTTTTQQQIASNSAYWNKRTASERKWIAENLKNDEAFNARIQEYFDKALTNIQKDIDSELAKYAAYSNDSMAGARQAVMATDIKAYQAEAKSIVDDARKMYNGEPLKYSDFSKDVNDRLKLYNATMRINRLEMLKSEIGQEMLDAHMKVNADLISKLSDDYQSEIKRQAGILGETVSRGGYTDLAKLLSKREGDYTFSQRIWINQDILKAELDELLTSATIQGQSPLKIARKLRGQVAETVNNHRYVTERIARTESARIQTQAQLDSFNKFGYDYCKWVAEPSACDACKEISEGGRTGKGIYRVDDVPDIPVHPNCRCSIAAYFDKDDFERESSDRTSADELTKNGSNPFTAMEDGVGAKNAAQFTKFLASMNDQQLRKLYAKYGKELKFNKLKNGRAHASGITIQLEQASFDGGRISTPMQTVFHEIGHAIDAQSLYQREGKMFAHTGNVFKKRMHGTTFQIKELYSHTSGDPTYKLGSTIRADLWQWATNGEHISPDELGKKPRKKAEKEAWFVKENSMFRGLKELREKVYDMKPTARKNMKAYSDASDVIEATGYSGDAYPWGAGHGASYWKTYGNQETEFFAEYTSARAANPESLKVIREMFPNACKVCDNIIDDMLKG
jgi:SPP1 gp7 family putative phage head morphogenesis protein